GGFLDLATHLAAQRALVEHLEELGLAAILGDHEHRVALGVLSHVLDHHSRTGNSTAHRVGARDLEGAGRVAFVAGALPAVDSGAHGVHPHRPEAAGDVVVACQGPAFEGHPLHLALVDLVHHTAAEDHLAGGTALVAYGFLARFHPPGVAHAPTPGSGSQPGVCLPRA